MSSLMSKLLKTSTVKATAAINDSGVYGNKEIVQTAVPMINVALSGDLDGGLLPGLTLVCGPSKHFKSGYTLLLAASFLKKYNDGVVLFYDSEFGTPIPYFEMFGIDLNRVIHTPITNVEELQFDIVQQLEAIEKKDRVMIIVDSIGNLASKREVDNALNQNSAQDMTRAKSLKALFRIVTPHLNLKDIPMVAVNHVYKSQGCFEADTLVMTEHGMKKISEITTDDKVWSISGLKDVTHIFGPDDLSKEGKIFLELTFDDGTTVKCTDNHEFLVAGEVWVCAGDLKIGSAFHRTEGLDVPVRKLVGVKEVPQFDLYDIEVADDHAFRLENGVIAHNSMYPTDVVSGGTGEQ